MRRTFMAVAGLLLAAAAPAPKVVAEYPGAFLENLVALPDGRFVVTSYLDSRLLVGRGAGPFAALAMLPAHPVAIATMGSGYIVTAHGKSFTEGPGFLATNRILLLDGEGRVQREVPVPAAKFLNGIARHGSGWLIADSIAATIWHFDPASGAVTAWLADPRLAGALATGGRPGANGLKWRDGALYVSNSAAGTIDRIAIAADGSAAGPPQPWLATGPVDDFAFAADGSVYVTTHGDRLLQMAPGRPERVLLASGCESCTAVAIDGAALLVLTTGNRFEGGTLPARILRLTP